MNCKGSSGPGIRLATASRIAHAVVSCSKSATENCHGRAFVCFGFGSLWYGERRCWPENRTSERPAAIRNPWNVSPNSAAKRGSGGGLVAWMNQASAAATAASTEILLHHFPGPSTAHTATRLVWLAAMVRRKIPPGLGQGRPLVATHAHASSRRLVTRRSAITGCGQRMFKNSCLRVERPTRWTDDGQ